MPSKNVLTWYTFSYLVNNYTKQTMIQSPYCWLTMEGFSERIRNLLWLTFGQTKFMFTPIFYQNKMKVFRNIAAKTWVLWNILELTFRVTLRFMISCSQFLGCVLLFCVFVIEKLTTLQDQKLIMNFFFDHFF